ncbi:DNA-directed RNA polymerase III subunit RPC8-like [Zophobas morio]|uniref:DNA-directed RNA polymerase III subunit RPC8-like n=1 Tax=Zophobas morio TaxID=2755281 RepID=UPI0030829464
MLVFRPFINEVLVGKVRMCNSEGVQVTLGFFDDILIPADCLQKPAQFDVEEQLWIWKYQSEEGTHDMYLDINQPIRFRIIKEMFNDVPPLSKFSSSSVGSPYVLLATIDEEGLGLTSWWS